MSVNKAVEDSDDRASYRLPGVLQSFATASVPCIALCRHDFGLAARASVLGRELLACRS